MGTVIYEEGEVYTRSFVDANFSTGAGSGIWPNRPYNNEIVVVAFSTQEGRYYGYDDRREGGIYLYHGMGPTGNMDFKDYRNKAMCGNSKILLFDQPSIGSYKDRLRFVGEFSCEIARINAEAYDKNGKIRKAIIFELSPGLGADKFKELCEERSPECPPGNEWKRVEVAEIKKNKLYGWARN